MGSVDWMIWRPVMDGYGSLTEVQTLWSIDDLMDCLEAISVKSEMERLYHQESLRSNK